jgi:hypothetical protein
MMNRVKILSRIEQLQDQVQIISAELEQLKTDVSETEAHQPPAFRELEAFGMWSDREEMRNSADWVENLRFAWLDRAKSIWGTDADVSD